MRISDWSSDVCSSDLGPLPPRPAARALLAQFQLVFLVEIAAEPGEHLVGDRQHGGGVAGERLADDRLVAGEDLLALLVELRSEERRVGKEGVRTGRSRGSP